MSASNFSPTTPYQVTCPTRPEYTIINEKNNELVKKELNEFQLLILSQMEERICHEHPEWSTIDVKDTCTLVRFLKARDFDLEKSYQLYVQRQQWIAEFKPHQITEMDVESQLKCGLLFWYGRDHFGRPIVYTRSCNHFSVQNKAETELFFKYFVYMAELGLLNVPQPPYNQFVIVADQTHLGRKNMDVSGYKALFCLSDYYPEVIHSIHVLYTPMVFNLLYKISKPFIDKKTLSKVQIHSSKKEKLKEELQALAPTNCLLPDHFGPREASQRVIKTWLPECCPEGLVFAQLKARSDGTTEPFGLVFEDSEDTHDPAVEESNEQEQENEVNDLDLD